MIRCTYVYSILSVDCRVDERPPINHISFIHKELLSKICIESDFEGLAYYGGPEVMCMKCDRMVILPCVEYDVMSGVEEEPKTTPKCEGCGTKFDVNKLLVCPIHTVASSYLQSFYLQDPAFSSTSTMKGLLSHLNTHLCMNSNYITCCVILSENGYILDFYVHDFY